MACSSATTYAIGAAVPTVLAAILAGVESLTGGWGVHLSLVGGILLVAALAGVGAYGVLRRTAFWPVAKAGSFRPSLEDSAHPVDEILESRAVRRRVGLPGTLEPCPTP